MATGKKKPAAKKVAAKKPTAKKAANTKPLEPTPAEKARKVMDLMEQGQSMRKACAHLGYAPSMFIRWVDAAPDLQEQYARARERLLDLQAEELEEIGERAARAVLPVEVAGLRLLSDNRKWLLSKLAPKKYGDRTTLAGDAENPLTLTLLDQIATNPKSRLSI